MFVRQKENSGFLVGSSVLSVLWLGRLAQGRLTMAAGPGDRPMNRHRRDRADYRELVIERRPQPSFIARRE